MTTQALNEEGGVTDCISEGGNVTTFALGEEGGAITDAIGEDGSVTTLALGEEGGAVTDAIDLLAAALRYRTGWRCDDSSVKLKIPLILFEDIHQVDLAACRQQVE